MKSVKLFQISFLLLFMSIALSSCEAIAGIFKAGMWTGIIAVVVVVGLIVYFISRGRNNG